MSKELLQIAYHANVPAIVWGPPGVGKSSFVRALAQHLGVPCEVVVVSRDEPTEVTGLPLKVTEQDGQVRVHKAPPAWAVRLAQAGKGILFLDELSNASPLHQAVALGVVLDGEVGDLRLPPGVRRVAAANPPEMAASGFELSLPMGSRMVHLEWKLETDEVSDGFVLGWEVVTERALVPAPDPEVLAARTQEALRLVGAFLRARPKLVYVPPQDVPYHGGQWPNPRTWEMAARMRGAAVAMGQLQLVGAAMASAVGPGAAVEFEGWLRQVDLPDPRQVLKEGEKFSFKGSRDDRALAIMTGVVAVALEDGQPEMLVQAWRVLAKAASEGFRDVAALAAKELAARTMRMPGLLQRVSKELKEVHRLLEVVHKELRR